MLRDETRSASEPVESKVYPELKEKSPVAQIAADWWSSEKRHILQPVYQNHYRPE
jgi:hypothetical protein